MLPLSPFFFSLGFADENGDEVLVRGLRRADPAAFRELFDRYHVPLFRFLLRLGVEEGAAEDVLQDVFAGVWAARERLDPTRSIRAYLYQSCRNRAANYFRKAARVSGLPSDDLTSPAPGPDALAGQSMALDHLRAAIEDLPERRRAVFELCFMEGLTYKEAASILEISPKTVENHMAHALKAIRWRLAPFLEVS